MRDVSDDLDIFGRHEIESTYEGVQGLLTKITGALAPLLDEAELGAFELCLAETLNNVVEHSYEERPGHVIDVSVAREDGGLRITILDRGKPNPALMQAARMPEPESLSEGGFGLALIRTIASKVDYERDNGANITTLWYKK